jgi:hypothetical protein
VGADLLLLGQATLAPAAGPASFVSNPDFGEAADAMLLERSTEPVIPTQVQQHDASVSAVLDAIAQSTDEHGVRKFS